jgi:non-heme chloroperoxidase
MSLLTRTLGASFVLGLVHLAARSKAARLRSMPDRYPLHVLSKEPEGTEVFIDRPDGTRLRAIHCGEGPTVVLAHGYGVSLAEWNVIWDLLVGTGVRVIAFDQRGHGKSTIGSDGIGAAPMSGDYKAILEHFDVHDGVLVGHSMGTFLTVLFLLNHAESARERLRGVVLISPTAGDVTRGAPQSRIQIPLIQSGLMSRLVRSETYGCLFGLSLMGDEPSPAAIEAFNRVFLEQDHDRLVPILKALAMENHYPRLGEIQMPCVVICGEKDRTTPAWHSRRLGAEIAGARNVWVPGKGHLLNWEAPEQVVDAIRSLRA